MDEEEFCDDLGCFSVDITGMSNADLEKLKCHICDKSYAIWWCGDCQESLCHECKIYGHYIGNSSAYICIKCERKYGTYDDV